MTDPKKQAEADSVAKTARERADVLRGLAAGIFRGLHEEAALVAGAEALEAQGKAAPKVLAEPWAVVDEAGDLVRGPIPAELVSEEPLGCSVAVFNEKADALVWARAGAVHEGVVRVRVTHVAEVPS